MRKAILFFIISSLIILPLANVLAVSTDYRYTGKLFDSSTNLYYYGQRYYNPNVGQFTQPDPVANNLANPQKLKQSTGQDLQQFLQNPQGFNSYSYTINNPVKYTDPTGEWFMEYITGKQSWSSFQAELGEAAMYVNPVMSTAIDHPYITGAIIGVSVPLAATGIGALIEKGLISLGLMAGPASQLGQQIAQKLNNQPTINEAKEIGRSFASVYKGDIINKLYQTLNKTVSSLGAQEAINQAQKSIETFYRRIGEHLYLLKEYSSKGGDVSSIEREIRTFNNSIKTLEKFIQDHQ